MKDKLLLLAATAAGACLVTPLSAQVAEQQEPPAGTVEKPEGGGVDVDAVVRQATPAVEIVAPSGSSPATNGSDGEDVLLAIRLRPGYVWRESVRFSSELHTASGGHSRWTLDYKLRLRCVDETDGMYSVDAEFIDWLLRLEHGGNRYEWHEGKFRVESAVSDGPIEASARLQDNEPLKELLFAWSKGLRLADVRFSLHPSGRIERFHGMETLREAVSTALLDVTDAIPEEIALYFGQAGLDRADCALSFALSVPRPAEPVAVGQSWQDTRTVKGLTPGMCEVSRTFTLNGTDQERRHRFASVSIHSDVSMCMGDGELRPLKRVSDDSLPPNELRLLLNTGLPLQSQMGMAYEMLGGGMARFQLSAQFTD